MIRRSGPPLPGVLGIVEIFVHACTIPVVLEMSLLYRKPYSRGLKCSNAFAVHMANTWIVDPRRAGCPQRGRIDSCCTVVVWMQDGLPSAFGQTRHCIEFAIHGADQHPHIFRPLRIIRVPAEFFEMVNSLRDGGAHRRCGVIDPVAAIAETRAIGIYMRERCHDIGRARSRDPILRSNQGDVSKLISNSGIGELFKRDQSIPDRWIPRDAFEQVDRRILGGNDAPCLRPGDAQLLSAPRRARSVNVTANGGQVRDVTPRHTLERSRISEFPVRTMNPAIRQC